MALLLSVPRELLVALLVACAARPSSQRALLLAAVPAAEPLAAAVLPAPAAEPAIATAREAPQAAVAAPAPGRASGSGSTGCLANDVLLGPAAEATTQAVAALAAICGQASEQCGESVAQGAQGLSAAWATVFALGGVESLASGEPSGFRQGDGSASASLLSRPGALGARAAVMHTTSVPSL